MYLKNSLHLGVVILSGSIEWIKSAELVQFEAAETFMEERVKQIIEGHASEAIWFLEHPPIYTAGTSAKSTDLISPHRFPIYQTKRGGQYTYHGPGQRVIYIMLDLNRRGKDVRAFVKSLENWVISALDKLNVKGEIRRDRVGVWVKRVDKPKKPDGSLKEDKIAAIGIRLKKWVSFHGISINVEPNLEHFSGIIPCGISNFGVTSFVDLGLSVTKKDVDAALKTTFKNHFF